jgi:hypothetical protein
MYELEAVQFLSNFDAESGTSTNKVLVRQSLKTLNRFICK